MLIQCDGTPIFWDPKLREAVPLSTTEAELNAMAVCVKEIDWIRLLLKKLDMAEKRLTVVHHDNLGEICFSRYVHEMRLVKYVSYQHHSIQEEVESGAVQLICMQSAKNHIDPRTRALTSSAFWSIWKLLCPTNLSAGYLGRALKQTSSLSNLK